MDKGYNDLWATLMTKEPYKDNLKDMLSLVEILLVLPLYLLPSASEQSRRRTGSRIAIELRLLPRQWNT